MSRNKVSSTAFEALVRQAVIDKCSDELDAIPPQKTLESMFAFSERHETMMRTLFRRDARRERIKRTARAVKRIAASFVIVTAVLSGLLMTNPNVRAAVGDTLVEFFDQFVSIRYQGEQTEDLSAEWEPEYLPEGFLLLETETLAEITTLTYRNEDSVIMTFDYSTSPRNVVYTDSEYVDNTSVYRDGIEYRVFEAESDAFYTKVIWEQGEYYFILISKYNTSELMNTAFSVRKK